MGVNVGRVPFLGFEVNQRKPTIFEVPLFSFNWQLVQDIFKL